MTESKLPVRVGELLPATRTDDALARARSLLVKKASVSAAPAVHVPVTCTRSGMTFLAIGSRNGDSLAIASTAPLPKARAGGIGAAGPSAAAGFFAGAEFPSGFVCPGCRRPHSGAVWACGCAALAGALHTCGDEGRVGVCACGRTEMMHFGEATGAELRGSAGSAPRATLAGLRTEPGTVLPSRAPTLLLPGKKG